MQSLGIDLSTDPKKVWICEIDWAQSPPQLVALDRATDLPDPRLTDVPDGERPTVRDEGGLVAALVERLILFGPGEDRVAGLDAPFGWPVAFVEAVSNWEAGDLEGFRKRVELRLRATDRFVQAASGVTPLSVSVDRIGSTAMLCAEVLSRFARRLDEPRIDRARALGGLAEVYPAAALRMWTTDDGRPLPTASYKTHSIHREPLLHELAGLRFPPASPRFSRSLHGAGYPESWYDDYEPFVGGIEEDDGEDWRRPFDPDAATPQGSFQIDALGACGVAVPPQFRQQLLDHDDALDAFLCALVARGITVGGCLSIDRPVEASELFVKEPSPELSKTVLERAERARALQLEAAESADAEGWIHVPAAGPMRRSVGLQAPSATTPAPAPGAHPTTPPAPEARLAA